MPKLKLTYFDFHGGHGEPARLALSIGGIPFEDDRVPPSDSNREMPSAFLPCCRLKLAIAAIKAGAAATTQID
jgi:hypothetical protein